MSIEPVRQPQARTKKGDDPNVTTLRLILIYEVNWTKGLPVESFPTHEEGGADELKAPPAALVKGSLELFREDLGSLIM